MPLDRETYERFQKFDTYARRKGLSLAEVLHDAEMLLTSRRRRQLEVEALENALRRLRVQNPNKLMSFAFQRVEGSSADMLEAVGVWLEVLIRHWADGTLEDL